MAKQQKHGPPPRRHLEDDQGQMPTPKDNHQSTDRRSGVSGEVLPGDEAFGALAMFEVKYNTEHVHHMLDGLLSIGQTMAPDKQKFPEIARTNGRRYLEQALGLPGIAEEAQVLDALKILSLMAEKPYLKEVATQLRAELEQRTAILLDSFKHFSWEKSAD